MKSSRWCQSSTLSRAANARPRTVADTAQKCQLHCARLVVDAVGVTAHDSPAAGALTSRWRSRRRSSSRSVFLPGRYDNCRQHYTWQRDVAVSSPPALPFALLVCPRIT
jgi:hypothetical protein